MKLINYFLARLSITVSVLFLMFQPQAYGNEILVFTETFIDPPLPIVAVSIIMTSGDIIEDDIPGPFMGTRYEGTFEINAHLADGGVIATPLNRIMNPEYPKEPLIFMKDEWFLKFADFNGDGKLETNLGQHGGSNGSFYRIIGFLPSGEAEELPFRDRPRGIFVADHEYSSGNIRVSASGETCFDWYDNTRGIMIRECWKWDPGAKCFVMAGKEEADS